jgi:hypothetical protein
VSEPTDGRRDVVSDGSRLRARWGRSEWFREEEWRLFSRQGATPATLAAMALCATWALDPRLDEDRCRRELFGCEKDLPRDGEDCTPSALSGSFNVEAEDVVDATEAVCCRRRDSSRVSRLTWTILALCSHGV